jgi:hypothetical protein
VAEVSIHRTVTGAATSLRVAALVRVRTAQANKLPLPSPLPPVLAGLAMNALGNWRLRHDQTIIHLDRFGCAYVFALALAAVRFFGRID